MAISQPLFSIITPAFNGETTITRTIECVLAQTERSLEHIIVDDCSRDGTVDLVREFAAKDPRVKLVTMPSNTGGPAEPKSRGIREAQGEFIAFCDQDDWFLPNKLDRFLDGFRMIPAPEVVFSDYYIFDESGLRRPHPYLSARHFVEIAAAYLRPAGERRYWCERLHASMLTGVATGMATLATAVRRDVLLRQPRLFCGDYRIADDIDLWERLAFDCSVLFIDEPLSSYFWGARTVSSINPKRYAEETLMVWRRAFAEHGRSLTDVERREARRYGARLLFDAARHADDRRKQLALSFESLQMAWTPLSAKLLLEALFR